MTPVSKNDARRICLASDTKLVFQEGYDIYYADFAPESDAEPFLVRGCLAVRTAPHWHIHALNGRSDLPAAIAEVRERMIPGEMLMILPLGDAPEEYRGSRGSFKLAREARPYGDPDVRPIVPEDAARIAECCAPDPGDTDIGQRIAKEALVWSEDPSTIAGSPLGLFRDGILCGFVEGHFSPSTGITPINIFVNRAYRGRRFAKRLLNAFCTDPGTVYCYSCVKQNTASLKTALSCGFQKVGEYLRIV